MPGGWEDEVEAQGTTLPPGGYDTLRRAMHKTSVYLTPEESRGLRIAAARTGRSQAELIREGVRLVTTVDERERRTFRSLARGHGGGAPYRTWDPEELHRAVTGRGR
jgi:hypothetical protein